MFTLFETGISRLYTPSFARRIAVFRFFILVIFCPTGLAAQPLFDEVSQQAGIAFEHQALVSYGGMGMGTGAAWFDYDRDGDLDLYITQGVGANHLYQNQGDGTFIERASELGLTDSTHVGSGVAVGDYDNDGWPDLFLANADADVLLKNMQGAAFLDVTEQVGIHDAPADRGMSAAWGDYNNDGYLDLYVANHFNLNENDETHQDKLYLNEGGESFVDVSALLGIEELNGYGFIGSWTDYDNDNDLDLFLINDCGFNHTYHPTRLFRNDGGTNGRTWAFTEVSEEVGANHCHNGMGIAVGDYDRDGHQEYFYTNIGERTLLLNYEEDAFIDLAEPAGVYARHPDAYAIWSWGANFFDYDLDGWLDLYVAAGTLSLRTNPEVDPQPNLLFRNRHDGTFDDVTDSSGMADPGRSRTSIYADYDNDGDPDLFLVNSNQKAYLFQNTNNNGHRYLIVELEGTVSNQSGIGAKMILTTPDGNQQSWEVRSGSSLGGGDDLAAYFGLGNQAEAASLEIFWPSGTVQRLEQIAADQRIRIQEKSTATRIDVPGNVAPSLALDVYPNPFNDYIQIRVASEHPGQLACFMIDALGRKVATPVRAQSMHGTYRARWEGQLASGVYQIHCTLNGNSVQQTLVRFR